MPKFRKKYSKKQKRSGGILTPDDIAMLRERKEEGNMRSSSLRYKDDIDSA